MRVPGMSAVIVNFDSGADLVICLRALVAQVPPQDILIVDNASSDNSLQDAIDLYPDVRVLRSPRNLGFGGGANLGAAYCDRDTLLFLNPDVVIMPDCIRRLGMGITSGVGVVGPQVQVGGSGPPEYGARIDLVGMPRSLARVSPPLFVSGCCIATTRQCYDAIGGFDERYFLFMEDVEYCWQALRRGFDVRLALGAEAQHRGGGSMPGGYLRESGIEVTAARILLRERNTLAMLLACGPTLTLPLLIAGSLLRTSVFAGLLAVHGRWRAMWGLASGLMLNLVWAPETIRRRRRAGVTRLGSQEAWHRVDHRLYFWDYLCSRQRVVFVDRGRRSPPGTRRDN